ncbi:HU domain-containing protein [Flavobacterium selenitireducens]|uniref:HU domain-containing protein n=1 Tax=Flavobacterium selenitireducens TaxID=2722704 RepID=UPI00168C0177|nr:SPOR domain-containing protein [Flavobacterium selenitireducens]MBD3581626.1 SPOR domain-containing protein [Flavobacterium selenitireducens]
MKIEHYISQLLYRYQCVTVPGFGAFLTDYQSAQLHESSSAFYPPKKLVSFNSHLKNNDGLLANHIALSEKTSYEIAVDAIQNEVSIWKNILEVNGRFTLKNIGELSLNSEKNVVFYPTDNVNYLTEAFGLSSFVSPAVKREEYKKEVEVLEEKAPIAFTPEARERRPYFKYAAVFVIAMGLSGFGGYHLYNSQIERETLMVETQVQQQVQDKIQEATFFIDAPLPAVTLAVKEDKLRYHIVAGVFRSPENADKATSQLKKLGFKSRRIPQNRHGLFPVLYGSFATKQEAIGTMNEIRKTKDSQAWLLIKEL